MNRKVFQQDTSKDMKTFPTHIADLDTGENSRSRDDIDGYEDTDGIHAVFYFIHIVLAKPKDTSAFNTHCTKILMNGY